MLEKIREISDARLTSSEKYCIDGKIKTLVFETDNGNGWYGTLKIERKVEGNINFDYIYRKML